MKRLFFAALYFLAIVGSGLADGLIIVREPIQPPGPFPLPRPIPPPGPYWPPPQRIPPPRHYVFAPLEVSYHRVNVHIKDQIAVTSVDQEFYNPNDRQLEGTYLFPVPKGAQIDKFSLEIGGKYVAAELLPADKARKIYEDIVRKMKDPALLEYAGRDVFKVRIFPIEPRSRKRVKLEYSQLLKADDGLVSYIYPLNTEKYSAKPINTVSLKIDIQTRQKLKTVYSPSHEIEIQRHGENRAVIGFEAKEVKPDADFQLYFAASKQDLGMNLMTFKSGAADGYFLLMVSPGFQADQTKIASKDVAFVLDTSGSMAGAKLSQAKNALRFCIANLNTGDRFNLIRFSTEAEPLFDGLVDAIPENRRRANEFVDQLKPIGGTAIDEALRAALAVRPEQSDRPFVIIFLTDGLPTVGITNEDKIVARVSGQDASASTDANRRIFCFGIGHDVNTHLLDKIAEATRAYSQYVSPQEDIELKVSGFFAKISAPVLTGIKLGFPKDARVSKLYPAALPDLFAGEQLVVVGRYAGSGHGQLLLEGTANGLSKKHSYDAEFAGHSIDLDFIPRLWATRRIGYLLDQIRLHGEAAELRDEATELAREFGIVTPYTAYLIVQDEARRDVPSNLRSLDRYERDQASRRKIDTLWHEFRDVKMGAPATAAARSSYAFKSATAPTEAVKKANQEAGLSITLAEPGKPSAAETSYSHPTQFVNGRAFFQNGEQWIDTRVQNATGAKRVRIQFASEQYFDLIVEQPEVLPWLALGRNVQFVLNNKIYEIYE